MHNEILTNNQKEILPVVAKFRKEFILVGGTAIALHIGHRESIDFDLFSCVNFDNAKLLKRVRSARSVGRIIRDESDNLTFVIHGVQMTFFHYPFCKALECIAVEDKSICMPDLLTLAAMKLYALGRRNKWKDYVDLYFILRDYYLLQEIIDRAEEIFGNEFNAKIVREQLAYFEDINYAEQVVYKKGFAVPDDEIKAFLVEQSIS